jgi:FkbM family methyltransferase
MTLRPQTAPSDRFRARGLAEAAGERLRLMPLGPCLRGWAKQAYHAALMLQTGGRGLASVLPGGEVVRAVPEHRHLSWNPEEYAAFRRAAVPGMVALDIGANVGAYAMLLGLWAGPAGRVFAFEPAPSSYRGLVEHVRLNRLGDVVRPLELAIGDSEKHADFVLGPSAGESRLALPDDPAAERLTVPVVTIDGFCRREGIEPDFIKIDVEGWELAVLRGARETIRRCGSRLALFVEMHPSVWPEFGTNREDMLAELREQRLDPSPLDGGADLWTLEGRAIRLRRR